MRFMDPPDKMEMIRHNNKSIDLYSFIFDKKFHAVGDNLLIFIVF